MLLFILISIQIFALCAYQNHLYFVIVNMNLKGSDWLNRYYHDK